MQVNISSICLEFFLDFNAFIYKIKYDFMMKLKINVNWPTKWASATIFKIKRKKNHTDIRP